MSEAPSILIVDDSPDKLVALESILRDVPTTIVTARSGREALRQLLHADFAVILLDVRMPGMDGFETAALIRERPRSAQTPIIFITAFGDETHVARGYSLRAVDYILTPVVPDVLRTKVSVFVDLFRAAAQVHRQAESLRLRAAQLHRLTAASLAIHAAPTVDTMLEAVARSARDLFDAACAVATARFDERRTLRVVSAAPGFDDPESDLASTLVVARGVRPHRNTRGSREVLVAPLVTREGRNIGAIDVTRPGPAPFSDEDEDLLVQLARMIAIAIENVLFAEAREANRLKDEFIATVSHELRTPLNALRSWAWILRGGAVSPEKMARAAEAIERNVVAQARIVDDLLDVSRIVTGKLRLNSRVVVLGPIIENAIEAFAGAAAAKGIAVRSFVDPAAGAVLGDPERLQQVVWNLLSNAMKFTPQGGRVDVFLDRVGADVRVRVVDSGQGIAPDFLPHVFERFRQADASSTRRTGGLGLGLAIVRHLVELHGGRVDVASPGEGLGATFCFTLPAAPAAENATETIALLASAEPIDVKAPRDLAGLRVLIVEDEPDTRDALMLVMSEAGAQVTGAADAEEALRELTVARPDVLVCDIGLPSEDGYALLGRVRALEHAGPPIPAIALTAYAQESDRVRALEAGFLSHLAKPVEPTRLVGALAEAASVARHAAGPFASDLLADTLVPQPRREAGL
jgi:signal transduction histidine kinase